MPIRTYSATLAGISGTVIEVEAARQNAIPKILITGLPGEIIKESRERVRACLVNLGFDVPSSRLVVNLSPAGARKQGSQFDLAIAISLLMAEGALSSGGIERIAFLGELSLDGRILRVPGIIGLLQALEESEQIDLVILPYANGWEARLIESRKAKVARNLGEVLDYLSGRAPLDAELPPGAPSTSVLSSVTLDDVLGQSLGKRALQIALSGRHHLLFLGSPGVGKSMLASSAPSLLPPLEKADWIQVVRNYTYCPEQRPPEVTPPFRSPHHSTSGAALLGGGSGIVIPGEVTLAHAGILFLDELPEFRPDVIEGLREPLQNGSIHLHRIGSAISLPARFTLLAAMNPCPCGYAFVEAKRCRCAPESILRYQKRVSGAVMDRVDLSAVLSTPRRREWQTSGLTYEGVKESILRARMIQRERNGGELNGNIAVKVDKPPFHLGAPERQWFDSIYDSGSFSFRSLHKIVRVARTIADLEGKESIRLEHLQEARLLRCPESYLPAFR